MYFRVSVGQFEALLGRHKLARLMGNTLPFVGLKIVRVPHSHHTGDAFVCSANVWDNRPDLYSLKLRLISDQIRWCGQNPGLRDGHLFGCKRRPDFFFFFLPDAVKKFETKSTFGSPSDLTQNKANSTTFLHTKGAVMLIKRHSHRRTTSG